MGWSKGTRWVCQLYSFNLKNFRVSILIYNRDRKSLVFVKQFRPGLYDSVVLSYNFISFQLFIMLTYEYGRVKM